jgi:hypothetical protein
MSLGEEVVWLTTQETAELDETDVEHLHRLGLAKEQIAHSAKRLVARHQQNAPAYCSYTFANGYIPIAIGRSLRMASGTPTMTVSFIP